MYWGVYVAAIIYAVALLVIITLVRRGVSVGSEEE